MEAIKKLQAIVNRFASVASFSPIAIDGSAENTTPYARYVASYLYALQKEGRGVVGEDDEFVLLQWAQKPGPNVAVEAVRLNKVYSAAADKLFGKPKGVGIPTHYLIAGAVAVYFLFFRK